MVKPQQNAAEIVRLHLALFLLSFAVTAGLLRSCGGDGHMKPIFVQAAGQKTAISSPGGVALAASRGSKR